MRCWLIVCTVLFLFIARSAQAVSVPFYLRKPEISADVYLIRHGEKIDDEHTGLSPAGQFRALCVENLFSQPEFQIDAILAQEYFEDGHRIRAYDTVKPLADRLNLKVDHHCDRDDAKCVKKSIKKAVKKGARSVLVCWEHDALEVIAEELGIKGVEAPSERFDLVWHINNGRLLRTFSEGCPWLD
ncbi:hypothetical protein MPSI1_003322 [Malassezia psittaci]|uniref:Histidine phosphatase family protein n=1 Tax=Malassezia psittaci TaxID=1821823 RepID=A0AAF0JF23_9BASI|nr:hypothetical protein MPSI1_003322 [Malassezia psittaci]